MSRQVVTALVLAGVVALASPAAAQRQRNPGGGGGGGRAVSSPGPGPGSASQGRGGRSDGQGQSRGSRPEASRGNQQPRQYVAPPQATTRQPAARAGDGTRYAVPREQANSNRGDSSPANGGESYGNRGYSGRYVDPGYARPGYPGSPRYAVPRGSVAPRPYGPGHGYAGHGYYGPPRYVAPGYRGYWGPGYTVIAPRYVSPYVLGYGLWRPYYYRPSIGIGLYYGADGLYPFGAVPQTYYDPAPDVVYGGVRITDAPRDAQVFADGNYVGIVDDFDGAYQHLNLEPGQHRVEIHAPGLTPIAFDIAVQPGRTITLRAEIY